MPGQRRAAEAVGSWSRGPACDGGPAKGILCRLLRWSGRLLGGLGHRIRARRGPAPRRASDGGSRRGSQSVESSRVEVAAGCWQRPGKRGFSPGGSKTRAPRRSSQAGRALISSNEKALRPIRKREAGVGEGVEGIDERTADDVEVGRQKRRPSMRISKCRSGWWFEVWKQSCL